MSILFDTMVVQVQVQNEDKGSPPGRLNTLYGALTALGAFAPAPAPLRAPDPQPTEGSSPGNSSGFSPNARQSSATFSISRRSTLW